MIPVAVISLESEAIRKMLLTFTGVPLALSAIPKPLLYSSLPFFIMASEAPLISHCAIKRSMVRSIFLVSSRSDSESSIT